MTYVDKDYLPGDKFDASSCIVARGSPRQVGCRPTVQFAHLEGVYPLNGLQVKGQLGHDGVSVEGVDEAKSHRVDSCLMEHMLRHACVVRADRDKHMLGCLSVNIVIIIIINNICAIIWLL